MANRLQDARIMVAEDDESNVLLLRTLLENAGYNNIHTTTDPRQVLQAVEEAQPDILLLDLHMPHMDGLEVMERVRTLAGERPFPILILSGDTNPHTRDRALGLGAADFLVKPFDLNAVLRCVQGRLRAQLGDESHGQPSGGAEPHG